MFGRLAALPMATGISSLNILPVSGVVSSTVFPFEFLIVVLVISSKIGVLLSFFIIKPNLN